MPHDRRGVFERREIVRRRGEIVRVSIGGQHRLDRHPGASDLAHKIGNDRGRGDDAERRVGARCARGQGRGGGPEVRERVSGSGWRRAILGASGKRQQEESEDGNKDGEPVRAYRS